MDFIWFDTKSLVNTELTDIVSSGDGVPLWKHHRVTARVLGYGKCFGELQMCICYRGIKSW